MGRASQNVKVLFMVGWFIGCVVNLLGSMWVKLNVMNLRKLRKFMDRLSDLNFQELFVFMKLLLRDVYE